MDKHARCLKKMFCKQTLAEGVGSDTWVVCPSPGCSVIYQHRVDPSGKQWVIGVFNSDSPQSASLFFLCRLLFLPRRVWSVSAKDLGNVQSDIIHFLFSLWLSSFQSGILALWLFNENPKQQLCHVPPPLFLQHIGLPMFAPDKKPKRIHMMCCGVLNLPRNVLLDWSFGHSLISCHVEHHLFPTLSDNMCLKVWGWAVMWLFWKENERGHSCTLRERGT